MKVLEDIKKKTDGKNTDTPSPKPKPSRTDTTEIPESLNRRRRLVKETIDDFAQFASAIRGEDTSDPGDLAGIIKRNADDLAFGIAAVAEKLTPLGVLIDRVCGRGGILSIARSFSSIGRWIVYRIRERRSESGELTYVECPNCHGHTSVTPCEHCGFDIPIEVAA